MRTGSRHVFKNDCVMILKIVRKLFLLVYLLFSKDDVIAILCFAVLYYINFSNNNYVYNS